MPLRRPVPALLVTAIGAAVLLAPTATAAAPPIYVALGDSYAAGFGLPFPAAPTGQPVPGCEQTSLDYPHRLASSLGLTLTDVACSGAVTGDFFAPQNVTAPPKPPAQLDAFTTVRPDLVSVTIGGNDLGFSSIADACLAASATGPTYTSLAAGKPVASCKAFFASPAGQASDPYARIPAVAAKVRAAIVAVQSAAPTAKVVVIAYPAIAPDVANTPTGGCFAAGLLPAPATVKGIPVASAMPFTDVDVPYLQVLQQQLDTAIMQQATSLGASYADVYPASLPHSACSPESTRWVEPVVPAGGGSNVLHPSLAGTQAMADTLTPVVRALLPTTATTTATTTTPTVPIASDVLAPAALVGPVGADAPMTPQPQATRLLANTGPAPLQPVLELAGAFLTVGAVLVAATPRRRRR